ncbi:MAG: hypothetical protein LBE33_11670 [Zoogloeaceae bacterium]|jgi:hypothetical protein|nr:hypothetical protein [Zoogloeaceae bacterium]
MKFTSISFVSIFMAVILLSGCDRMPAPHPDIAKCWEPGVKGNMEKMFKNELTDSMLEFAKADANARGTKLTMTRDELFERMSVSLDMIHAESSNPNVGSLTCGSNITVTFMGVNGKQAKASGVSPSYTIFKGQNGDVLNTNTAVLTALLTKLLEPDSQ